MALGIQEVKGPLMFSSQTSLPSAEEQLPGLLHPISTLTRRGCGGRATLRERIKRGEVPAVRVGSIIKVHDRDLHLLATPVATAPRAGGDAA